MIDLPTLHRRASRVLPANLQTRAVLTGARSLGEMAQLLLPLWRQRRGSVWFRLDEATARELCEHPEQGLRQARTARAALGRQTQPLQYARWRSVAAAPQPIYRTHTRDHRAWLWLLPQQGLLVYAWDDAAATPARRWSQAHANP